MRLEETYPDTSVIVFSLPEPQEPATELAIRYQTMPSRGLSAGNLLRRRVELGFVILRKHTYKRAYSFVGAPRMREAKAIRDRKGRCIVGGNL